MEKNPLEKLRDDTDDWLSKRHRELKEAQYDLGMAENKVEILEGQIKKGLASLATFDALLDPHLAIAELGRNSAAEDSEIG